MSKEEITPELKKVINELQGGDVEVTVFSNEEIIYREETKKQVEDNSFNKALDRLFEPKEIKPEPKTPIPNHYIGERVEHLRFGAGTIKSIKGDKCNIVFDSGIEKDLLMKFAKLKTI